MRYIASDTDDKTDAIWPTQIGAWTSGDLEYEITGLSNGTQYDIQVRAVNGAGNSLWSTTRTATPRTVPGKPDVWTSEAGHQQLRIVWSSPSDDGGADITSYDLRHIRADAPDPADDAAWTLLADVSQSASSHTITGLENGVSYHVEVRAKNAAGNGPWSDRASGSPKGRPGEPTISEVTNADASLVIKWNAPESDGGTAVTSYNLRHIRNDATDFGPTHWTKVDGIWTSGDLSYTLTGLTNEVRYRLSLQAVNSEGPSNWSNFDHVRTGTPGVTATAPGAPTVDSAVWNGQNLDVSWSAPADDGDADITRYDLRHILNGADDKADDNWTVTESAWTSGALEASVPGLDTSVRHDVQVRAVNYAGTGEWSDTKTTTGATVPGPVYCCMFAQWDQSVWISWNWPEHDGGSRVTRYEVRYIRTDVEANWTLMNTDGQDNPWAAEITGLTNYVEYKFEIRAVNRAGQGPWEQIYITPRKTLPKPENVILTPGDGKITATWTAPALDDDMTITGYYLQWLTKIDLDNGRRTYRTSESPKVPADGNLEYEITGLRNGTQYAVMVRSYDATYNDSSPWDRNNWRYSYVGTAPSEVSDLKRTLTRSGSVAISWGAPPATAATT